MSARILGGGGRLNIFVRARNPHQVSSLSKGRAETKGSFFTGGSWRKGVLVPVSKGGENGVLDLSSLDLRLGRPRFCPNRSEPFRICEKRWRKKSQQRCLRMHVVVSSLPPPPQRIYLRKTIPEELFSG